MMFLIFLCGFFCGIATSITIGLIGLMIDENNLEKEQNKKVKK